MMDRERGGLLTLRLDPALLAEIDGEAAASGVSRSAWLRTLIHSVLGHEARSSRPIGRRSLALHRVYCGLPGELLRKVDAEAEATGLRRNVFIRRVLHAQLYEGDRFRVLSDRSDKRFAELKGGLSALQRMVNRIERAVRAIIRDGKYADLAARADDLLAMDENITAAFKEVERFIIEVTFEEHRYWRGDAGGGDIEALRSMRSEEDSDVDNDDDEDLTTGFSEDEAGAGD